MNRDPSPSATPTPNPIHDQQCKCWRCLDAARLDDRAHAILGGFALLISAMAVLGGLFGAAFALLAEWATHS